MGISCMLWNNSVLYLVSTQYLVVCFEYLLYLGSYWKLCKLLYFAPSPLCVHRRIQRIQPLSPARITVSRFLKAECKITPTQTSSRHLKHCPIYRTSHQSSTTISCGSNRAMNLCILHKYLNYDILWLIMHSYTIYRHATRSARFAVSRALHIYRLVYQPLAKRATQRNSRRLWLHCLQPQRTAQHGRATLDFCAYCIKTSVKNFETLCKIL